MDTIFSLNLYVWSPLYYKLFFHKMYILTQEFAYIPRWKICTYPPISFRRLFFVETDPNGTNNFDIRELIEFFRGETITNTTKEPFISVKLRMLNRVKDFLKSLILRFTIYLVSIITFRNKERNFAHGPWMQENPVWWK